MTEPRGHPYPLRHIGLRDFKSVAKADVELGPLTVVVGANSSGKSTLLQSILALAQVVRSGGISTEFPLNGQFLRLGTFDETRNFRVLNEGSCVEMAIRLADRRDRGMSEFSWRARLGDAARHGELPGGFAQIESLQLTVESSRIDSGERTTSLTCEVGDLADASEIVDAFGYIGPRRSFPHRRAAITANGLVKDQAAEVSEPVNGVVLAGAVPMALTRSVQKSRQFAEIWWDLALESLEEEIELAKTEIDHEGVHTAETKEGLSAERAAVEHAITDIESLNRETEPDLRSTVETLGVGPLGGLMPDLRFSRWHRNFEQMDEEKKRSIARSMVELGENQFYRELSARFDVGEWIDEMSLVEYSGSVGSAFSYWGYSMWHFFTDGIRYLGPLREAPHVLYDPGPSKLDLGLKGEYSAAVLHSQATTEVLMPDEHGGERRQLGDALDYWLKMFELADGAQSEDRGRMGIGLSVTPLGLERRVDLTAVGVGVSQIIPVIILCLLAGPGTLVVLEQPELHLHPRLEQKLADFLLACVRSGRQLVVETHSEHLVNRLRYHIASDPTDETHDLIKLVFAERGEDGTTSYREPEINAYGGIGDDWPAGFLDLSAREAQDLVRESLLKRKRDRAADDD